MRRVNFIGQTMTAAAIFALLPCAAWAQGAPASIATTATPVVAPQNSAFVPPAGNSAPPVAGAPGTTAPGVPPANDGAAPGATAEAPDGALMDFLGAQTKLRTAQGAPEADESVLFTPWQHALLQEAKRGFLTKPASASGGAAGAEKPPAIREISLGGIVYRAPSDWTIYLNNQRVTPTALPEQVLDIKVSDNDIKLKWFDTETNLIFPVVLHANQRFNLDARMFLPGVGVASAAAKVQ